MLGSCVQVVKAHHNICKVLHMPAQSGSTRVLQSMRRGYSREAYLTLVDRIRTMIPEASPETLAGAQDLSYMRQVKSFHDLTSLTGAVLCR